MIHRALLGSSTVLLLLGPVGCRDTKQTEARTGDTTIARERKPASTPDDSNHSRVDGIDATGSDTTTGPADVVRRYYDTIQRRQYDTAYALWDQSGKASGQSRAGFANGFRDTMQTNARVSDSVHIEGAAGSQYATVPVTVDAVLRDGTHQRFVGTYTVRRAMVDGATPEQRRWHIYSAKLQQR